LKLSTQLEEKMDPENESEKKIHVKVQRGGGGGGGGPVYGLGLIGACMYYMKGAETTQDKIKAFGKALVWPVFVVRDLLIFLNKQKAE
jgi:hypothetical protein